jgi:hypothetical protein
MGHQLGFRRRGRADHQRRRWGSLGRLLLAPPTVPDLSPLQLAGLGFLIVTALMVWRLWVGVEPKGRWLVLGSFAATFLMLAGSRWLLGMDDLAGSLFGAAGAYAACLLVTRGRPERMLEVWRATSQPPPSREARRSVTLHQIAFCALVAGGVAVYFWAYT